MSKERNCRNCAHAAKEWSPKYEKNLLFCHCEGMPRDISFTRRFHGDFCCNQWKPNDGSSAECGVLIDSEVLVAKVESDGERLYQQKGTMTPEDVIGLIREIALRQQEDE